MATSSIARRINEIRVLRTLFDQGHMSRADVARDLGLTKSTMTNVIGSLLAEKLIGEFDSPNGRARVGRPGISVGLNPKGAYFLGAEIRRTQVKVIAFDLSAQRAGAVSGDLEDGTSPAAGFARLKALVNEIRRELPATASIKGLCLALPGFVTPDGVLLRAPHLGWRNVRVREQLERMFRWPVFVENDANLAAFGEWYLNRGFRNRHLALVSMTDGVGCGFISEGRIVRGAHGLSGEMGHVILDHQTRNGSAGVPVTWEQAVDKRALLSAYAGRTGRTLALDELVTTFAAGDSHAAAVVGAWARWLAYGLLSVVYAVDPDDIIIAGEMAPVFAACRSITEATLRDVLIEGFPIPHIVTSSFGEDASTAGAAALVHHSVFDAASIKGMPVGY